MMRNALIAQSGGPTSVINASLVGVINANKKTRYYDKIYGGVNGIEGLFEEKIIKLNNLSENELKTMKYSPASSLGSCRYKLKHFEEQGREYQKIFNLMDELEINTFFYIGGNDSMGTVSKLSEYAKTNDINKQIIGIPKTIDNDLMYTDHTPGYGSAAKYIATTVLETYFDSIVYKNNGVFILETMGRDTGWLAASAALAEKNSETVVDFIYLPEMKFSKEQFLLDVSNSLKRNNNVYIVVAEGIKDENGDFLYKMSSKQHDGFSHTQLGGVCNYLKRLIIKNNITSRVKTLELGVTQRCSMHCVSGIDMKEAYKAGKDAMKYSIQGDTGFMVGIRRIRNDPYTIETFKIEASKVANQIKYFPAEWINEQKNNVNDLAIEYIFPLIRGFSNYKSEKGIPEYCSLID
ncbi:MAG TPA: 6-phosphofructokinase [Halanaerobiales bacterium]|nr:6-phosphofructokinase [Halanaerobiales bacterium]